MNISSINIKEIIIVFFLSIVILAISWSLSFFDKQTKIVFCDVGQGDASYIRIKNKIDVLIDTGPNKNVLNCLGKHMPFYDRKIELLFISHWQKDHAGGLKEVIKHYDIERIISSSNNDDYNIHYINNPKKAVKIQHFEPRTNIHIHGDIISVLWPGNTDIEEMKKRNIDINDLSLILLFQEKNYKALFTGDAEQYNLIKLSMRSNVKVNLLKVPHHGSKNGLYRKFLELANPEISVISVGKNNQYGHRAKETLDIFKALNKKYLRTDEKGDIVIKLSHFVSPKADYVRDK